MPNMSCCRFENTLADLRACQEVLEEESDQVGNPLDSLGGSERDAAEDLLRLCKQLSGDYASLID